MPLKYACLCLWLSCRFKLQCRQSWDNQVKAVKEYCLWTQFIGKSDHSALPHLLPQELGFTSATRLSSHACPVAGQGLQELCLPSLPPTTHGNPVPRSNPNFGIRFRSKWLKTIYVILEVICQVGLDCAVVSSGQTTHPWKLSLSNTRRAIFKSKHDGDIPMQDGKPVVDTYTWVGWGAVEALLELRSSRTEEKFSWSLPVSKEKWLNNPGLNRISDAWQLGTPKLKQK